MGAKEIPEFEVRYANGVTFLLPDNEVNDKTDNVVDTTVDVPEDDAEYAIAYILEVAMDANRDRNDEIDPDCGDVYPN